MFRPNSKQGSLFQACFILPDKMKGWLLNSWAEAFQKKVLSSIPEEEFAHLYHKDKGAPNFPVALLVGLSIIKEILNLTDEQLIDAFHFNLKVLHALGLAPGERTLAPRTLYYFRDRVVGDPAVRTVFEKVTDEVMDTLAIAFGKQRLDSTQVSSHMANLSRLRLFVTTIERFLETVRKRFPDRIEQVPAPVRERYLDRAGYFADATGRKSRGRLERAARDLAGLVEQFAADEDVKRLEAYQLLRRLFGEQCEIDTQGAEAVAVPKPPCEIPSTSLQNPSDPDATYNRHKGKGYQAQIAETCEEANPTQIITHVEVEGAHESDQNATIPFVEDTQARGIGPGTLLADTNYNSGDNQLACAEHGVELVAPTPGTVDPDDLTLMNFEIDGVSCEVRQCPEGHAPVRQKPMKNGQGMNVHFDPATCGACELSDSCPAGKKHAKLRITWEDLALAGSRAREETPEFKQTYKKRSGIEATVHELKTGHGLGRVWTRGKDRVTFAVFMKALACNVKRFARVWCARTAGPEAESAPTVA